MKTIICDFDMTLVDSQLRPIDHVIDFLNKHYGKYNIAIVSGRPLSAYNAIEKRLKVLGVKFNRIYLNPNLDGKLEHKKHIARKLNKDNNVALAIDDDIHMLNMYKNEGINAVSQANLNSTILKFSWNRRFA